MIDKEVTWTLTPALIALVLYILCRNYKWHDNDSMSLISFLCGVMGGGFGTKIFHFDSHIPVFLISSLVTILAMGLVTMNTVSRAKRKHQ